MNIFTQYIHKPSLIVLKLGKIGFFNWMSDKCYLRICFRIRMGKQLNLNPPKTFNEKIQWLKLYDRNPLYTKLVDKYEVKEIVANRIGKQYIIPTLGVWNKLEDIDFDQLPTQFVLKCTHDSGGLVICKDKSLFDFSQANKIISSSLKRKYYWKNREWPYKDVKPRIIAEPYLEDNTTKELRDYKFFCFDGEVKALFVATERGSTSETKFDFFDENYMHLPFTNGHPNADVPPKKPEHFEEMKDLASKLSQGIPHVRVDLYECNGRVYFGEMTFSHWSGLMPFSPEEWDYKFGSWIKLPQ